MRDGDTWGDAAAHRGRARGRRWRAPAAAAAAADGEEARKALTARRTLIADGGKGKKKTKNPRKFKMKKEKGKKKEKKEIKGVTNGRSDICVYLARDMSIGQTVGHLEFGRSRCLHFSHSQTPLQ